MVDLLEQALAVQGLQGAVVIGGRLPHRCAPQRVALGGREGGAFGQALVRTLEDGTVERVPIAGQGVAPNPSANHLKILKQNPGQAALLDEIYGPGAAKRYLG